MECSLLCSGLWHAHSGHQPASSLFNTWWGSVSFRAAFPACCWGSQFASSSQQKRRLREGKLSRAGRLASREQRAVILAIWALGLVSLLIGFALCRLPLWGC